MSKRSRKRARRKAALAKSNEGAKQQGSGKANSASESCPLKDCAVQSLLIKCGHGERSYQLDVLEGKAKTDQVIQVLAGYDDADEMEITFTGKCDFGNPDSSSGSESSDLDRRPNIAGCCPYVLVEGNGVDIEQPSPLKVKIRSDKGGGLEQTWPDFFKRVLIPSKIPPVTYRVQAHSCEDVQPFEAMIEAFPSVGWTGEVTLGYEHGEDDESDDGKGFKQLKPEGEWKLKGKIEATYDERSFSVGASGGTDGVHKDQNLATKGLFEGVQGFLNKITPFLGELKSDYGSIKIRWPALTLSGGVSNCELEGAAEVGINGKIAIKLSPLIGAEFSTDVMNWIIKILGDASGGFGSFLVKVKAKAAEGLGGGYVAAKAVIELVLTVGGDIGGELEWSKKTAGAWTADGKVSGGVDFTMEGKVHVEGRVFMVTAAAGVSVSLQAQDGSGASQITGNWLPLVPHDAPELDASLEYNGLAVYAANYVRYGVESLTPGTDEETAQKRRGGKNLFNDDALLETEDALKDKILDLIEPAKWQPSAEGPAALDSGL